MTLYLLHTLKDSTMRESLFYFLYSDYYWLNMVFTIWHSHIHAAQSYWNWFSFHLIVKYLIQIGAATNSITVIQTSTLGNSGASITCHNATSNPNDNSITRHNQSFSILYAAHKFTNGITDKIICILTEYFSCFTGIIYK